MRKIVIATVILVSLLVASCYWAPETGVGSVRFSLHPDLVSHALINNYDTMRVYLLSASKALLQHDDGLHYREFDLNTTDTVEVEGVPPGTWDVLVSLGAGTSDGFLLVAQYGAGTGVAVTAGSEQDVSVTLADTPLVISSSLLGQDVSGAVYVNPSLYASVGNAVFYGTGPSSMGSNISGVDAYTLNGISEGLDYNSGPSFQPELWLDTTQGIVPVQGLTPWDGFQLKEINVSESIVFPDDANDQMLVLLQRPKGFGGVSVSRGVIPAADDWTDVDQLVDTLVNDLVLDFAMYGDNAYIATTLGAFRIPESSIEAGTADDFVASGLFFNVPDESPIYSLDVDSTGNMFIGTADGVYRVSLDGNGQPVTSGAVPLVGTAGFGFTTVSVSDSDNYSVFLSSYDLFVYEIGTGDIELMPFYAGLPGLLNDFAWNGDILYLSGTGTDAEGNPTPLGEGGLVSLDVASLF